jgi:predicted DNA-binding helix-hairpin-helix protein
MEDLPFNPNGHLPLDVDPKYAWARNHLIGFPIEINKADKHTLLRIPGIGPKAASMILAERIKNKIYHVEGLTVFGVNLKRAAPFILVNGKVPVHQETFL